MRRILHQVVLAVCLGMLSNAALAQFGFSIPGVGTLGGGKKSGGTDIGSVIDNVKKMTTEPSEEEEVALGREFAARLLGAKKLLPDAAKQKYVNALGRWLASQTERPNLPWTFGVLEDDGYNAFAAPGGYIFVTNGLLERMRSEAELVGVLSHEIAHVLKKHHLNAVKSGAGMELLVTLASKNAGVNDQLRALVKEQFINVFAKGLERDDEFEADRIGVVIAARAGYDPFGLLSALQVLGGMSAEHNHFALMFKTHPSPAARLERLDQLVQGQFDNVPTHLGKPLAERTKEFK